jgi:very-short-patch-repair endonuclease
MEFDSVIYEKRTFFRPEQPLVAFEVSGGEHFGNAVRERLDAKKRELCEKHGLKLIVINNEMVKDYEFMRELLCKMSHENYDQILLNLDVGDPFGR